MRDLILSEIRRIAAENDGQPPGVNAFATATGITSGRWRGVYWARWGDALVEAGFEPNRLQERFEESEVLLPLASLTRELGRLPTRAEIKLRRRNDPSFPSPGPISNRYRTNAEMIEALRSLSGQSGYEDLAALLPEAPKQTPVPDRGVDGSVYLLKSGKHFKIGRSDNLHRRFSEIKTQLPEALTPIHTIRTDDPVGIEAYWHRRFAEKRAGGEWFELTPADVKAFCRRTFQ